MTTEKSVKEPLFHIVKRESMVWWKSWLVRIGAVVVALLLCGVITLLLTGLNPLRVFAALFEGALGTSRRIWILLQNTAILLCLGLAVTPAFRMRFWNTGAEGQALIGGMAAAACMLLLNDALPAPLLLAVTAVASIVAGAIWAVIPAIFKAFWNTNETLFTLMMNYIAIQLVCFFCQKWTRGTGAFRVINDDTHAGWLPVIGDYKYLLNILIVAVLTALLYVYLRYSKHGYEISVVGESENTARYIGINVKKVIIRTMLLSGAICGIAGLLLVSGTDHTITRDTVANRGFTAILVSWLAKFNPVYMILTSFLIVFLQRGALEITSQFTLSEAYSEIITGIIIFFIIGSEFFLNYELKFRHAAKEEKK